MSEPAGRRGRVDEGIPGGIAAALPWAGRGRGCRWLAPPWLTSLLVVVSSVALASPGEPVEAPAGGGRREAEVDARPAPPEPAPVDLDRLLRLPDGFNAEVERRGGVTAAEWRSRFRQAREHLEQARVELARVEEQLDAASDSSSAWQVSAPGSDSPETSPLSFRLRQQVKEQRADITASERQLRALEVEADLADVPAEWRE